MRAIYEELRRDAKHLTHAYACQGYKHKPDGRTNMPVRLQGSLDPRECVLAIGMGAGQYGLVPVER